MDSLPMVTGYERGRIMTMMSIFQRMYCHTGARGLAVGFTANDGSITLRKARSMTANERMTHLTKLFFRSDDELITKCLVREMNHANRNTELYKYCVIALAEMGALNTMQIA